MSEDDRATSELIQSVIAEIDGGPVSADKLTSFVRLLALQAFHQQAELMELRGRINSQQGTIANYGKQIAALRAAGKPGEDSVISGGTSGQEGGK